jgi:3-carboxy-cis,cis-muconate cycloisomerase
MPISPADSKILSPLFNDFELATIFSDEHFVKCLLRVEGALARVEGELEIIPRDAAAKISTTCETLLVDLEKLQHGAQNDGLPIVALVKQIQAAVGQDFAPYVHWGATTQDIMDTALVLQIRQALTVSETKLASVIRALVQLANKHRHTVMAGRTHSQQALPITFGFKVATWLAPLLRHYERLQEIRPRVLVLQFGGAVGTMAALEEKGVEVQSALARELELNLPLMAWHTQRDSLAELANWLSLVSASLAKTAQDILLLTQTEIGEVRESDDTSRGGSSTMPQKSNPIVSELIVACARANASLLSNMHHAIIQEHERATHGWQLEWLTLPQMFANTVSALNHAEFLSEHLAVNETRMMDNVRASNGLMLAEAVSFALSQHMPRTEAKQLVTEAARIAVHEKRHLVDVVREKTNAPLDWNTLSNEAAYLGSAENFIERVLQASSQIPA